MRGSKDQASPALAAPTPHTRPRSAKSRLGCFLLVAVPARETRPPTPRKANGLARGG